MQALVVAGPNGAGKTTFVREYLEQYLYPYISADVIAEGLSESIEEVRLEAGKRFLRRVTQQINKRESFVVESTLSGLTFKKKIHQLKESGYEVSIVFIFLGSVETCVARIQQRVRKGGHPVRESDVRRRFARSIRNFWWEHRNLVDCWYLFYNGAVQFHDVALGEGESVEVRNEDLFELFLRIAGEEVI